MLKETKIDEIVGLGTSLGNWGLPWLRLCCCICTLSTRLDQNQKFSKNIKTHLNSVKEFRIRAFGTLYRKINNDLITINGIELLKRIYIFSFLLLHGFNPILTFTKSPKYFCDTGLRCTGQT